MPEFRMSYKHDTPTPQFPKAFNHGVTTIEAADEEAARYELVCNMGLRDVKNLRIESVEEIL